MPTYVSHIFYLPGSIPAHLDPVRKYMGSARIVLHPDPCRLFAGYLSFSLRMVPDSHEHWNSYTHWVGCVGFIKLNHNSKLYNLTMDGILAYTKHVNICESNYHGFQYLPLFAPFNKCTEQAPIFDQ